MKVPRIMLADDHTLIVEAIRNLLEPRCEVVGAVSDGRALVELAASLKPDAVLVDIAMPLLNGLDAMRQLKVKMPEIKLICLTMNEDPDLVAGDVFSRYPEAPARIASAARSARTCATASRPWACRAGLRRWTRTSSCR